MKDLRNVHNTVIHRTRRPSHPCGGIMAGVRGWPRAIAPIKHYPTMRATPVVAYGRSNDIIAPSFLGMRCPDSDPLFASLRGFTRLDDLWKLLIAILRTFFARRVVA